MGGGSGAGAGAIAGGALGSVVPGVGTMAGAAIGGYLGSQLGDKPKDKSKAQKKIDKQYAGEKQAISEMDAQKAAEDAKLIAIETGADAQFNARQNQKSKRSATAGKRGTILTSPLGVTEDPNAPQKTLLGN